MRTLDPAQDPLVPELQAALARDPIDLAATALVVAKLEYPSIDARRHLDALEVLGSRARRRVAALGAAPIRARVRALNTLVFEEERFAGNRRHYDDFRNNYLNAVLERRLGIPITLALVYMEVARRADVDVQGVAFPGHFLLSVQPPDPAAETIVLDPFDGGAEVDAAGCRRLLARYIEPGGDDALFDRSLLRPCSARQIVARMLNNLKRTYLELRAFARARRVSHLLLIADPTGLTELRDRGLLSYYLDDLPAAMRDLDDYLRLRSWKDEADREERTQLLEHIATVKKQLAGRN
jgi:regulator of sirC expression with transglutaminase-like and TPR domain